MLEQVRHAGFAIALVARTNQIGDVTVIFGLEASGNSSTRRPLDFSVYSLMPSTTGPASNAAAGGGADGAACAARERSLAGRRQQTGEGTKSDDTIVENCVMRKGRLRRLCVRIWRRADCDERRFYIYCSGSELLGVFRLQRPELRVQPPGCEQFRWVYHAQRHDRRRRPECNRHRRSWRVGER